MIYAYLHKRYLWNFTRESRRAVLENHFKWFFSQSIKPQREWWWEQKIINFPKINNISHILLLLDRIASHERNIFYIPLLILSQTWVRHKSMSISIAEWFPHPFSEEWEKLPMTLARGHEESKWDNEWSISSVLGAVFIVIRTLMKCGVCG